MGVWHCDCGAANDTGPSGVVTPCTNCRSEGPKIDPALVQAFDAMLEMSRALAPEEPKPSPIQDPVDHPVHYNVHPSGIECIQITEHMNLNLGNAVKYIWRAGEKGNAIEDLKKARWYIAREIARLERGKVKT